MTTEPRAQFICEPLTPAPGSADIAAMAKGEPGLPERFTWRDCEDRIAGLIEKWNSYGSCKSSSRSKEMYLRRHWYKVLTDPPMIMTIYCDRQAKNRAKPKSRWFVHTVEPVSPAQQDIA